MIKALFIISQCILELSCHVSMAYNSKDETVTQVTKFFLALRFQCFAFTQVDDKVDIYIYTSLYSAYDCNVSRIIFTQLYYILKQLGSAQICKQSRSALFSFDLVMTDRAEKKTSIATYRY